MFRRALIVVVCLASTRASADERWSLSADALVAQPEHDAPADWYTGLRGSLAFAITPMFGIAGGARVISEGPGEVHGVYWEVTAGPTGRFHLSTDWSILAQADFVNGGVTMSAGNMAQTISGLGFTLRGGVGWEPREHLTLRAELARTQLWLDAGDLAWRSFELGAAYGW